MGHMPPIKDIQNILEIYISPRHTLFFAMPAESHAPWPSFCNPSNLRLYMADIQYRLFSPKINDKINIMIIILAFDDSNPTLPWTMIIFNEKNQTYSAAISPKPQWFTTPPPSPGLISGSDGFWQSFNTWNAGTRRKSGSQPSYKALLIFFCVLWVSVVRINEQITW